MTPMTDMTKMTKEQKDELVQIYIQKFVDAHPDVFQPATDNALDLYQRTSITTASCFLSNDLLLRTMVLGDPSDRATKTMDMIYGTLGLAGEAGEFADKVKKVLRDNLGEITEEKRLSMIKELGDVMWYVSVLAAILDVPLSSVGQINAKKLADRREMGTIHGQGDNR